MSHLPIFMTLQDRPVLLVGGGELAMRKLRLIRKSGAAVTLVTPHVCGEIEDLAGRGEISLRRRAFEPADVDGNGIVFAATGLAAVDSAVSRAARARNIPVNAVDRPALSDFIMPAIVDRAPIVVAISSGGSAPVLARMIRARIESQLPPALGRLAAFANRFRGAVKAMVDDGDARRRFWERFFAGPVAKLVLAGDERKAQERMLALVNADPAHHAVKGGASIVGAGPGDPDLLTFRAMRAIQEADVVVYDRLVGPDILEYVRRDAERVFVGKSRSNHHRTQDEINALLADLALAGKRVVRLKGGDPFVFGRGGEERDYLMARGVEVDVLPGITVAVGAAAYAGVPLTHRDHASAVTFVTGHGKDGEPDLDWAHLAKARQTVVIYMGVDTAGRTAARLLEHGMASETPVAVIENATRPDQRVVTGVVRQLGGLVAEHAITGPALLVIGSVAGLAETTVATPADLAASG